MLFSILIPSLYEIDRIEKLTSLKISLHSQILSLKLENEVEILVLSDNRQETTGKKRQKLLEMAKGEYIAFIDDDDAVSDYYIEKIMEGIQTKPDAIGIRLTHYIDGKLLGNTIHSIKYNGWENIPGKDGIWTFTRCPNHLNPVKRKLALKAGFPDKTYEEDKEYSYALRKYLKTEYMVDYPIYFYMEISKV
jgi:glycosyltransferase involved in cell wall biosynthesis